MSFQNVFLSLLLLVVTLALLVPVAFGLGSRRSLKYDPMRQLAMLLLVMLALICLLGLFGCGTAPLQVQTSPPVPAALLTPPRPPVLLPLKPPSTTPGPTTAPMPRSVPKTGLFTSV